MSGREFQCPRPDCQKWFRADDSAMGRLARCPHCKNEIRVPGTIDKKTLAGSRKTCRLRIKSGPAFEGIDIPLDPDRSYTFGRSDTCDQQLPDPSVSRRHFSLHWVNSKWVIEDLNTSGGTEVNSLRITRHQLEDADRIKAGEFELAFRTPQKRGVEASVPAVLPSSTSTEPLAVAEDPDAALAVEEAGRALRGAGIHFEARAEYQEDLTERSMRQYRLSLATSLLLVVALIAGVGLLSVYGKRLFQSGGKTESAVEAVVQATPDPLPAAFIDALGKRDLEMAEAILQERRAAPNESDELAQRMGERFQSELRDYNGALFRKARDAVQDEDWDTVDELLETAATPLLATFASRWDEVKRARQLHDVLGEVEQLRTAGDLSRARAKLIDARDKHGGNRRLQSVLDALKKEMNAGLRASLTPNVPTARVSINGELLGPAGADYWKLDSGQARIEINAPGYFRYEDDLRLSRGELQVHRVRLRPLPSPEIWALDSLRRSGNDSVLWLAAAHYAAAPEAPFRRIAESLLTRLVAAPPNRRQITMRVVEVELKDGRRVRGRFLTQTPSTGLSMLLLPAGEAKTFPTDSIVSVSDLPPKDRISLMAKFAGDKRSRGVDVIKTLKVLAALRAQLSPQDAAAFQPAEDLVRLCLSEIESGCAGCVSLGKVVCERCAGKGRITETVTCDRCRGTREMRCVTCRGDGRRKCKKCRGKGSIKRTIRTRNSTEKRSVKCPSCSGSGQQPCKTCSGNGQVTCPRCKGIGERDVKVDCPVGERGRMECPDCGGVGRKDAMTKETRLAAELAAAEWAEPVQP